MNFIKKFEEFKFDNLNEGGAAAPAPAPAKPGKAPSTTPAKPGTAPSRPGKPSPIRRDKPAVDPAPKAGRDEDEDEMPTASINDVIKKYAKLTNQKYK